jgi:tetratricopeptide (TPR) repeat protein
MSAQDQKSTVTVLHGGSMTKNKFKVICPALGLAFGLLATPLASAAGSGPAAAPAAPRMESSEPKDTAAAALRLYNDGVKLVQRADQAGSDEKKARKDYLGALKKFESAVDANPEMAEAWNYIGYCRRQTGDYGGALGAYDEALRLKPGFPEAIEYRGHAYLGLSRVDDSKRAYLDLFGRNRALADKLLAAIRNWSGAQRAGGKGDAAQLGALDAWITEREKVAQQTAALGRVGSAAGWN